MAGALGRLAMLSLSQFSTEKVVLSEGDLYPDRTIPGCGLTGSAIAVGIADSIPKSSSANRVVVIQAVMLSTTAISLLDFISFINYMFF
jgi:hypothetical protein